MSLRHLVKSSAAASFILHQLLLARGKIPAPRGAPHHCASIVCSFSSPDDPAVGGSRHCCCCTCMEVGSIIFVDFLYTVIYSHWVLRAQASQSQSRRTQILSSVVQSLQDTIDTSMVLRPDIGLVRVQKVVSRWRWPDQVAVFYWLINSFWMFA